MIVEQTYTFKIVRGCEIQADVYSKSDGVIHPAITWIHGGALI